MRVRRRRSAAVSIAAAAAAVARRRVARRRVARRRVALSFASAAFGLDRRHSCRELRYCRIVVAAAADDDELRRRRVVARGHCNAHRCRFGGGATRLRFWFVALERRTSLADCRHLARRRRLRAIPFALSFAVSLALPLAFDGRRCRVRRWLSDGKVCRRWRLIELVLVDVDELRRLLLPSLRVEELERLVSDQLRRQVDEQ